MTVTLHRPAVTTPPTSHPRLALDSGKPQPARWVRSECTLRLLASPELGDHRNLLVDVGGDADLDGVAAIRRRLLLLAGSGNDLTLSLVGITSADEALIHLLTELSVTAAGQGREVRLVAVSPPVVRLLGTRPGLV